MTVVEDGVDAVFDASQERVDDCSPASLMQHGREPAATAWAGSARGNTL